MNDFDRKWHFTLLSYSSELEAIGDIIEKNLFGTVMKQVAEGLSFNPDDAGTLNHLYQKTLLQFDLAVGFITTREAVAAQKIINARDEIKAWCLAQKKNHYERLKPGDREALSGSLCFLDLLEGLRRVSNHLSTAAYGFKPTDVRAKKTRVKSVPQNPASASTEISSQSGSENPQAS
jgi:phosphate:Na+ symporter